MLQLSPASKIYIAIQTVDGRKGIDGLAALCRKQLQHDPFSGALFLFRTRSRTTLKMLLYDGQGFWLCMKRLSKGRFTWWPDSAASVKPISPGQLQVLLWNGNPLKASMAEPWRKVS